MGSKDSTATTDKTERHRFSLAKLFSSRPKKKDGKQKKSSKSNLLQMDDLQIVFGDVVIKIVLVGDNSCGKTRFIIVASKGDVPETYIPTVFENYIIDCTVDGVPFQMRLWDTSGQEDYDRLRPLSYQGANVICICFTVGDAVSFENVKTKWAPEIEHFNKELGAARFLLGFRRQEGWERGCHVGRFGDEIVQGVGREEVERLAAKIGAFKYLECEVTKEGVSDVFPTILRMVLEASPGLRERVFASHGYK